MSSPTRGTSSDNVPEEGTSAINDKISLDHDLESKEPISSNNSNPNNEENTAPLDFSDEIELKWEEDEDNCPSNKLENITPDTKQDVSSETNKESEVTEEVADISKPTTTPPAEIATTSKDLKQASKNIEHNNHENIKIVTENLINDEIINNSETTLVLPASSVTDIANNSSNAMEVDTVVIENSRQSNTDVKSVLDENTTIVSNNKDVTVEQTTTDDISLNTTDGSDNFETVVNTLEKLVEPTTVLPENGSGDAKKNCESLKDTEKDPIVKGSTGKIDGIDDLDLQSAQKVSDSAMDVDDKEEISTNVEVFDKLDSESSLKESISTINVENKTEEDSHIGENVNTAENIADEMNTKEKSHDDTQSTTEIISDAKLKNTESLSNEELKSSEVVIPNIDGASKTSDIVNNSDESSNENEKPPQEFIKNADASSNDKSKQIIQNADTASKEEIKESVDIDKNVVVSSNEKNKTSEGILQHTDEISNSTTKASENIIESTKELAASTSEENTNQMAPDASDEIPEVTDSLGLLSESFRVMDEDRDDEQEDHDDDDDEHEEDGDGDGDEDDEFEHDEESNQMTAELSEDSNTAAAMETDITKDTPILPKVDSVASFQPESTEVSMDVDVPNEITEDNSEEKTEVAEKDTVAEDGDKPLDNDSCVTEKDTSITNSAQTTVKEDDSKSNLKKAENEVTEETSQLTKKSPDTTPTKSSTAFEKLTPSKKTKLEISKPKHFVSIVDLEDSSSEDDLQVVQKADEPPKTEKDGAKETACTTVNVEKEKEDVASPSKIESTDKNNEDSVTNAETKVDSNITETKSQDLPPERVGLEVFNLDSDEDMEATKSDTKESPKKQMPCINILCPSEADADKIPADLVVLRFFDVKKRRKAYVCLQCANLVAVRMQKLVSGVKCETTPLLDIDMTRPEHELVEISDSDTDDEEGSTDACGLDRVGDECAQMLEEQLADIINGTWRKYNLEQRLKDAKEQIDIDVETLEKESKEIDKMLSDCQAATDRLRNDLYSTFTKKHHRLQPLEIWDTQYDQYIGPMVEPEHPNSVTQPTKLDTSKDDDNTDIKVVKLSAESAPPDLPPPGELVRPTLHVGMQVLAMRNTSLPWTRATVEQIVNNQPTHFSVCRVKFETKLKSQVKSVSGRQVAAIEPTSVRLTIGTRVVALFKNNDKTMTRKSAFFPGIIAEVPNPVNSYRYLVFFDDGYAQYVNHADTRLVCECSSLVWEEVHPDSRDFVRQYIMNYPERPMVRLHPKQRLNTEWNGKWWQSRVISVDASLAQVYFEADRRVEWVYRGSTRLAPLYLELKAASRGSKFRHIPSSTSHKQKNMPYVEYTRSDGSEELARRQRAVAKKSTSAAAVCAPPIPQRQSVPAPSQPDNNVMSRVVYYTPKAAVKPLKMLPHHCSCKCRRSDVLPLKELRTYNPLARPLLSGWERQAVRTRGRKEIMYRAPCGRRLRNMAELHKYLQMIDSDMSVDLFDFSPHTHCLAEFVLNRCLVSKKDLSHGKENVPVPCVNYYDTSLPEFCSYNTERTPTAGVPLNTDPDFLCGCDCTDDCADKSKCACWKLTMEGARTIGMDDDVGYVYKRLLDPVPSGIYECNSRCKCRQTCLNRVAQHPLQLKLQVFKTVNRGWGIRALNDIPRGAFLCVYAGNLLTDATANLDGLNEGDEYLAELDYIEVVEQMKEGYEEDIPNEDKELDKKESKQSSTEEESAEEEVESTDKYEQEDDDFKPNSHFVPGPATDGNDKRLSKRLRRKQKKEEEEKKETEKKEAEKIEKKKKENNPDGDCITISDDEDTVREPSRFTADGMESNDYVPRHRSVRSYYGKDEACYIMDAKVQGNIGRYLNHSCTPNVFVQNVFVDTHDPRFPWVAFFALAHVKAGTELTWNYNYDVGSVPGKVLYCYCGTQNCRGRLL